MGGHLRRADAKLKANRCEKRNWKELPFRAAILAYKFATIPTSVFESRFTAALHHYLGGSFFIPKFHDYGDF
jgi:hypothetical protein